MSESATPTSESANSAIVPFDRNAENEPFFGASDPKCQSAKVPRGYTHTVHGGGAGSAQAVESANSARSANSANSATGARSATGHVRGRGNQEADPAAFARLLDLIADREVTIWFDGAVLHWKAGEDAVDAELLRLLRLFKEPLRQAWGPDRLPPEEPDEKAGKRRR